MAEENIKFYNPICPRELYDSGFLDSLNQLQHRYNIPVNISPMEKKAYIKGLEDGDMAVVNLLMTVCPPHLKLELISSLQDKGLTYEEVAS
jgi:hypothetical protein